MRGLPAVVGDERLRAKRWDALVLGTALPGLVAAVRLAMHGKRVLVLEEEAAAGAFPGLREPFLVTGAESGSLLGPCMQALGLSLIDRRRLAPGPLAYQVVLPDARIDVGEPSLTARELVAWGLAKPDQARALVRDLAAAVRAERSALLASATEAARRLPRSARRPSGPALHPAAGPPQHRGLPEEVTAATGPLAAFLAAQVRALSSLGQTRPSPEATALLLGVGLEGASTSSAPDTWLRPLLRRRLEALFGEIRVLDEPWRLVSVDREPGIELADSRQVWTGRALMVNASRAALASALDADPLPEFLRAAAPARRRATLHLRVSRPELPEAMASRVVCVRRGEPPLEGTDVVTIRTFPGVREGDPVDVIACAVIAADDPDPAARDAEMEAALAELMPFSAGALTRVAQPTVLWDDDAWLAEPSPGTAWPHPIPLRLSSRPLVYGLERGGFAGLGLDGDLLLGWRAGDGLAAELG